MGGDFWDIEIFDSWHGSDEEKESSLTVTVILFYIFEDLWYDSLEIQGTKYKHYISWKTRFLLDFVTLVLQ